MRMNKCFFGILFLLISWNGLAQGGDCNNLEQQLKSRSDVIFYGGFEEGFNNSSWEERWGIEWITQTSVFEIVPNAFQNEILFG